MSSVQSAGPVLYLDDHTVTDQSVNSQLVADLMSDVVAKFPGLKGINFEQIEPGAPGELSTAKVEDSGGDGATIYYFGGFATDERSSGIEENIEFYFSSEDEQLILQALKDAGLIPQSIKSMKQLGSNALGVIENAVDQGVLEVNEHGALGVGKKMTGDEDSRGTPADGASHEASVSGDEENPVIGGAKKRSRADDAGNGAGEPGNADGSPGGDAAASGQNAGDGADVRTEPKPPEGHDPIEGSNNSNVESSSYALVDGEAYLIEDRGNDGFYIRSRNGDFVHVNSKAFDEAGFLQNQPTSDEIADAFEDGSLQFVEEEATVVYNGTPKANGDGIYKAYGENGQMYEVRQDSGQGIVEYRLAGSREWITVNAEAWVGAMGDKPLTAGTFAEQIKTGSLVPDDQGNLVFKNGNALAGDAAPVNEGDPQNPADVKFGPHGNDPTKVIGPNGEVLNVMPILMPLGANMPAGSFTPRFVEYNGQLYRQNAANEEFTPVPKVDSAQGPYPIYRVGEEPPITVIDGRVYLGEEVNTHNNKVWLFRDGENPLGVAYIGGDGMHVDTVPSQYVTSVNMDTIIIHADHPVLGDGSNYVAIRPGLDLGWGTYLPGSRGTGRAEGRAPKIIFTNQTGDEGKKLFATNGQATETVPL
ncbi:hypothetical protein [Limnobacter sp.]|uniref:hypothetical protein n=1 Tax=Limnobacter sp. TaxID=2003368 RepID=UPI0035159CF3